MSTRCWSELVQYGALQIIQREYGPYISPSVEPGYDVTLAFDIPSLPQGGERAQLIQEVHYIEP